MTGTRPAFGAFLGQVATLSSEQGRNLAELRRIPDWRRDRDARMLIPMPIPWLNAAIPVGNKGFWAIRSAEDAAATDEARRIVGDDTVEAARQEASEAMAGRRLSWPGMRLHHPLRVVMWASIAAAALLVVLRPTATDAATMLTIVAILTVAFGAGLARYLLPPSAKDLQAVVELAAVAHIAGASLADEHFEQLAGGWYAVLEGRWHRGPRPYLAWGCLVASVLALLLLGAVLEVTGAGN